MTTMITLQVLDSGVLQAHGIKRVGLASHPEGSPDIDPPALQKSLDEKNQWAEVI